jgi:hypothetical protein
LGAKNGPRGPGSRAQVGDALALRAGVRHSTLEFLPLAP